MFKKGNEAVYWLLANNKPFRESIAAELAKLLPGGADQNLAFKPEVKENGETATV